MDTSLRAIGVWEKAEHFPQVKILKKIIDFLGYYPLPEPTTFGGRVRKYRHVHGLRLRDLARMLRVTNLAVMAMENDMDAGDENAVRKMEELINAKEPST